MLKRLLLVGAAALLTVPAAATTVPPPVVQYDVSFPSLAHHRARIAARFTVPDRQPLRIEMARSSPGRYAIHEFAKNVSMVSATDGAGRPLRIERTDPYGWTVAGHDGTVVFSYSLYADRGDGTYSQVDATHAHLNMPATFAYAPRLDGPVAVNYALPDARWSVATQMPNLGNNLFYTANRQLFMDSPTEIAPVRIRSWTIGNQAVRIALHSTDSDADVDRFATMAEKIYRAQVAMWGAPPRYDYGNYTFLADFMPNASSDGMEHRDSTYLVYEQSLKDAKFGQVDVLTHELFHSWNVERLRPRELEPFDFSRANPTPSLWLAEGFTSYYGPLLLRRSGVQSVDRFLDQMSRTIGGVINGPGRHFGGPAEMSLRAPFVDAARSIDPADPNIFTSYYPYGATLALALDLELRANGKNLDQVMRALWAAHGANERPYTLDDVRAVMGKAGLGQAWADGFFAHSVLGHDLPDYAPLLARAGLTLRAKTPQKGWVGLPTEIRDKKVTVSRTPTFNGPAYAAGLDSGDVITAIDGKPLDEKAFGDLVKALRPGQQLKVAFTQRGIAREAVVTAAADPTLEIVRNETIGAPLTPAQSAFRTAWLGADGTMLPEEDEK